MTRLARAEILRLIPHAGAMCLLDEVLDWNEREVRCCSQRFAAVDNPLRRADGTFGVAGGIEIAAQAMAVHGRLTSPAAGAPRPGYLVSLRNVRLFAAALGGPAPLIISAARLLGDDQGATYDFSIEAEGDCKLQGRATVLFGAAS